MKRLLDFGQLGQALGRPEGRKAGPRGNQGSYCAMKLAIVALAASAKTTRTAPVSTAGAVRSLARLTAVLGVFGLACGTAGGALAGQPEQFRYHLVPLDDLFPVKVANDGKV